MPRQIETESPDKPIHAQVLAAAQRLCRREDWTFDLLETVRALPHLNERSVRTHIVSRCCENAPKNHPHRWPYFRRVGRGLYQIQPPYRQIPSEEAGAYEQPPGDARTANMQTVRDSAYSREPSAIHAVVTESEGWFVAECLEVAVITQGRTLDETLANLRSALALHLDDDELARTGLPPAPRLLVNFETSALASEWPA